VPDTTTIKTPALPTEADLQATLDLLNAPTDALCGLRWQLAGVADFRGDHSPTFEDVGRLFWFLNEVDYRLDEIRSYVQGMRESLPGLDYVRAHENVNPDEPREAGDA
jgi:hypothetical protein